MTTDVSLMQVERLLSLHHHNIDINDYDVVFLNLTSILNTLFYESIIEELKDRHKLKDYIDRLQIIFKNQLMAIHRINIKYYFYYSSKPSLNKKYYELWDSYINKYKFIYPTHDIYEQFIIAVKALARGFNNITVIDTGDAESAIVPYHYSMFHSIKPGSALIISRDLMDFINIGRGYHLFDSVVHFKSLEEHTSKKLCCIPKELIKYYLYLLPIEKHSYSPPLPRAGKKNSVRYLISAMNQGLETAEVFHTKAFTIFDYEKYIKENDIWFNYD